MEDEFGVPLLNGYGITECSPGLAGVRQNRPAADETVGPMLPGIEHRIVDRDGNLVAEGEVGELHVRGLNVMLGYYRAPDQTAAAIDRDGWFNTGDLARMSGEGNLYIEGAPRSSSSAPASTSIRPRSRRCSTRMNSWCSRPSSDATSRATRRWSRSSSFFPARGSELTS